MAAFTVERMALPHDSQAMATAIAIERVSFPNPWTDRQWTTVLARPGIWGYLFREARDGADPFGYVFLDAGADDEVHVVSFAILPEKRQRGLGTQAMRAVLERERPHGTQAHARSIILEVRVSNGAAQRMYRTLGFVPIGYVRGYYANPKEDALRLRLTLKPADEAFDPTWVLTTNPWRIIKTLCGEDETLAWPTWEYTAVQHALKVAGILVDDAVTEVLCALQAVITQPYQTLQNWGLLEKVLCALNGHITEMALVSPPTLGEMYYGIDVIARLGVPIEEASPLTYPARAYIEAVLHEEGVSMGLGVLEGIVDRTTSRTHRTAVEERYRVYRENKSKGVEDNLQEDALDIEVAKLDTMIIYAGFQRAQEPPLSEGTLARLTEQVTKRIPQ